MAKKTFGQRAEQQAASALGLFDTAVSGLNEANRLLALEVEHAEKARTSLQNAYRAQTDRILAANIASRRHERVLAKIEELTA